MTSTRWKSCSFLLFGSLPLLLLSMAVFSVPRGWSDGWRLAYAFVTYALVGLAYNLVNIPYGPMAPALTQVPEERARLAAFRSMGSAATVLMLSPGWSPADQALRRRSRWIPSSRRLSRLASSPLSVFCYSFSPS